LYAEGSEDPSCEARHRLRKTEDYSHGLQWVYLSVILVTWEVEIGRVKVQGQLREIVHNTPTS
jgi:hypothetical protein